MKLFTVDEIIKPNVTYNYAIFSDLHIGSKEFDAESLIRDLKKCVDTNTKILLNGDTMDMILLQDIKRAAASRIKHEDGQVNKYIDEATEILMPFVSHILMIAEGNHECHDEETEILTEDRGWVYIKDLKYTDKVATFNMGSEKLEFQHPEKIHKYDFDGYMKSWNLRHSKFDFCVTPNHRMVIHNNVTGDNIFRFASHLNDYNRNSFDLMTTISPEKSIFQQDDKLFSDDELRLFGWIITDGCLSNNSISIYQSKEQNLQSIRDLLQRLGVKYKESVRSRNIKHICGKKLKKDVKPEHTFRMSAKSSERYLEIKHGWDNVLKNISVRQTRVLLETLIAGDGNKRGNGECCTLFCGKKELADKYQIFFIKRGINASIYMPPKRNNDYRLNITFKNSWQYSRSIKKALVDKRYVGKVYCVTVPNSTTLTRRNGKTIISGNSAITKHHGVNVLSWLIERLNKEKKNGQIQQGHYSNFVRINFLDPRRNYKKGGKYDIFMTHGVGGAAPVSKGMIDFNRIAVANNADLYAMGHKHNHLETTYPEAYITDDDRIAVRNRKAIQTPSYTQQVNSDKENAWIDSFYGKQAAPSFARIELLPTKMSTGSMIYPYIINSRVWIDSNNSAPQVIFDELQAEKLATIYIEAQKQQQAKTRQKQK